MKILFFLALSISAFSQTQYLVDSVTVTHADLMTVKLREVVDKSVRSDGYYTYTIESNVQGSSLPGNKARLLIYQAPMGITITDLQLKQIADYIKSVTEVVAQPDKVTRIDDTDPRITYSGTWFKQASTGSIVWPDNFLNKNVSYTQTANAYSELKFFGTGIEAVSELRENHATATVFIDGVKVADVDMYKATQVNAPTVIYSKKDLVKGDHTIRVQLTGISGARNSMVGDGYVVYERQ